MANEANTGASAGHGGRKCWAHWFSYPLLVSGDDRAGNSTLALTELIKSSPAGDPANIRAGYQLDGAPGNGSEYVTMAFVAPFGAGAIVSSAHQDWLIAVWQTITDSAPECYDEDTIKLLWMIVM